VLHTLEGLWTCKQLRSGRRKDGALFAGTPWGAALSGNLSLALLPNGAQASLHGVVYLSTVNSKNLGLLPTLI